MQGNLVAFSWVNASSKVNLISVNIAVKKNQIIKKGRGVEHGLIRITHVPHFTNCSNVGIEEPILTSSIKGQGEDVRQKKYCQIHGDFIHQPPQLLYLTYYLGPSMHGGPM